VGTPRLIAVTLPSRGAEAVALLGQLPLATAGRHAAGVYGSVSGGALPLRLRVARPQPRDDGKRRTGIYRLYTQDRLGTIAIAHQLRAEHAPTAGWGHPAVHRVLTNPT
jgi:hypothetical protein